MGDVGADPAFDVGAEDSNVGLGVTADAGTRVGVVVMTQLSPQAPGAAAGAQELSQGPRHNGERR